MCIGRITVSVVRRRRAGDSFPTVQRGGYTSIADEHYDEAGKFEKIQSERGFHSRLHGSAYAGTGRWKVARTVSIGGVERLIAASNTH